MRTILIAGAPAPARASALFGMCSSADGCNDSIAKCVGAGGDFHGVAHGEQGRPVWGSCKPVRN